MSVPRILLLTGTSPGEGSVGEIYLRDLCLYYPKGNLCCFELTRAEFGLPVPSPDLDWLPIAYGRLPRQAGIQRLGRYFERFSSFPVQQYIKYMKIPALVEQVVQFGKQHEVEMVWGVLNRATLINMARKVAEALDVPIVTLVWDLPEYWLKKDYPNLDGLSRRFLLREFENVLRASVRCSVVSEEMQNEYEKRYGVESVILRHGIHPDKIMPPAKGLNKKKQFVIGVAGTFQGEWQPLLSALSKLDWQIDGRDVIVRSMGRRVDLNFHSQGKMHFEYLGWRSSVEEVIELLSQVDITYLPYWFDEFHRLFVRLSFPTKLPTYLAAGRPVLFHGPEDSSPARFFRRFPVGLCCHSLEESKIIECLHRFATDREFYAMATEAGQAALDQELNLRVFLRLFATLIGIEEGELLPISKRTD